MAYSSSVNPLSSQNVFTFYLTLLVWHESQLRTNIRPYISNILVVQNRKLSVSTWNTLTSLNNPGYTVCRTLLPLIFTTVQINGSSTAAAEKPFSWLREDMFSLLSLMASWFCSLQHNARITEACSERNLTSWNLVMQGMCFVMSVFLY